MRWTFIQLAGFTRLWRAEGLSDEDLAALEAAIMEKTDGAPVMKGTGGLRKIRFAPPSFRRGKSGAMRIGYAQFPDVARIYLVTLFLKKDEENLSAAECAKIRTLLTALAEMLRKGRNP